MPREQSDASYLRDMLAAARAAVEFTRGRTLDEYSADLFLRSAVERQIEIIGEAAGHLGTAYRKAHSEIPWDKVIRQRTSLPTTTARLTTRESGASRRSMFLC